MPRIAENTASLVADLATRLERLVAAARAEGRDEALAEVRGLISGQAAAPVPAVGAKKRGRPVGSKNKQKPAATRGKARKSSWAGLSPEARLARVNAIRKGRRLPPKDSL